ncbi:MAG: hypothetical protein KAQ68_00425 [Clostridiales bacterium]|nr:hypothetical protein [Clostridiales bacterium]
MKKIALFAFKGNSMCFVHVLLNAIDLSSKEYDVKIIIEGEAVTLIKEFEESKNPLYKMAKEKGLIDCICKACSVKLGVYEYNQSVGIPINGEMHGHVPMAAYTDKGYEIITM